MAGPSSSSFDLNKSWAEMCLEDEKEDEVVVLPEVVPNVPVKDYRFTMVGSFLTDHPVKYEYMKQTLAALWKPLQGFTIDCLHANLFTYKFYCQVDLERFVEGSPWTYDQCVLLFKVLEPGDDPYSVELFYVPIWIQVYNLPVGYMSEMVAKEVGTRMGGF